jgi:DNA (cytosine-5)-methyltransferase 1
MKVYPGAMGKALRYIDLFAGIGGLRIPFDELGCKCVFTSEIDRYARQTYASNFQVDESEIIGDIREVHVKDIPDHDILLGGFPCQPFSHAGHRRGFDDTRGTLFFDVARILKKHQPKAFLLENVRGLVGHDNGNTFRRIIEILGSGYVVHHALLNAKDFGLPQSRLRVYIVGIRKDLAGAKNFKFPTPPKTPTTVGDILESRVPDAFTISDRLWSGHLQRKARHERNGNGFGYRLFTRSSPHTATISARYYKDGSEILIAQRNKNPRKLTPKEAARLQGFPDWFQPNDSKVQAYKQFGNAVPVTVVRAVAIAIVKAIR